jgi:hypothetical protein
MRSGTSLVAHILDAHSRVAILFESYLYPVFRPYLSLYGNLEDPRRFDRLIRDVARSLALRGWDPPPSVAEIRDRAERPTLADLLGAVLELHARREGKPRAGEKTPQHHAFLPEILERVPQARVVFTMRDPRDTVFSTARAFGTSPAGGVEGWLAAWRSWQRVADRVLTVRYEDLVRQPEPVVHQICDHVGESFEPGMLKFYQRLLSGPEIGKFHHHRLREPMGAASVGRGRALPPAVRAGIEAACAEGMAAFGYASGEGGASPPLRRSRVGFLLDRARYYGLRPGRWKRGWIGWRIPILRGPGWLIRRVGSAFARGYGRASRSRRGGST